MHNTTLRPKRLMARITGTMAVVALLAGFTVSPAGAAPPPVYIGLGDSYAAGTGGGPSTPPCHQTPAAYPTALGGFNAACFGATTVTVVEGELPYVPADATQVTVTVGGNDIGAGAVAATCTSAPSSTACRSALFNALVIQLPKLPARIATMVQAIRLKAPNARIAITGYPRLFTPNPQMPAELLTAVQAMNRAADLLNGTLAFSALANRVRYISVTERFINHGIGSGDPWIVGPPTACIPSVNCPTQPEQVFHPTATGHARGYTAAVASVLLGADQPVLP